MDVPARIAHRLRDRTLDAAFLSPIEFAREGSAYAIIGRNSLSSAGPTETITLHFREGLHGIATIAADPAYPSEIVLASVILAEEFDLKPSIIPAAGSRDEMLRRADAALLVGDASLRSCAASVNHIDLVECWTDLTELPYVHGFWCTREGALTPVEAEAIRSADAHRPADEAAGYLDRFSPAFGLQAQESLREFFHYAYYRGILPDVPDLVLLEDEGEEALPPGFSPN